MRRAAWIFLVALTLSAPAAWSSDYLFLSPRYITLTRQVINQTDPLAAAAFEQGSALETKYAEVTRGLRAQMDAVSRGRLFKKLKPELVAQVKDEAFAANLNDFKNGLRLIATKQGKTPSELIPAYAAWVKMETFVVQQGIDQRLQAFQTRFGPDSEQVNFIELFTGEALFRGDEAAPSAWEPITRLSAVQLTTSGPGLTSTFELGMNYYFVNGEPPVPWRWIGLSNHAGLAATLQYLNDPRLLHFTGRPAFGLALHLDRKELGASWDPDKKTVRITLGYAFQFVPLLL